jgi:hypothetical protein
MLTWYAMGAPAFGNKNGDLEYGQMEGETLHMRNIPAYQEAEELYREWIKCGKPAGTFSRNDTEGEYIAPKDYFYVKGRTGAGSSAGPRGHFTAPLEHPLWAYTGNFSIRFTDTGYPKEGYVEVEIENYTSLPSFLHGVSENYRDGFQRFLDGLYTKKSGIPIASRSRQVYRFRIYIPRTDSPTSQQPGSADKVHKVVAGDSLSALAKRYYGDIDLWPILYQANRGNVGDTPDNVRIGVSLTIPARERLTTEQIASARQTARSRLRRPVIRIEPLR